jgi:hypothetical protein
MNKSFETPEPIALAIRVPAGSVVLESAETGTTDVELEPLDDAAAEAIGAVRIELRGRALQIEVPERRGFFGRNPRFGLRVRCPHGSSADVRTRSADVDGRGRFGAFDVKTASGDVEVERVDGETRVASASGDVELRSSGGAVTVNTASGDVSVGRAEGLLKANLVSGDLTVREADGGVEAHTVSGDQRFEAVGPGSISANSVSGDVVVRVRRGANVWMDVRSISGDTTSELDAGDGPPADESMLVELRLNTVSGDVRIERAAAAAAAGDSR